MAGVEVTFGANIQELVDGIDGIRGLLGGLAATLGAAFSVERVENFIKSMAELGDQATRTATILGVSAETAQEFATLSALGGGDARQLTLSLERLQVSLQRGAVLTSQQAEALRALGLTQQQLVSVPIDKQIDLFADAYKRLADKGINPVNAMTILFGRNAAGLAPILAEGSAGIEAWKQRMIDVGAVVDGETIKSLEGLDQHLTLVGAAMKGLGETIVGSMAGNLSKAADEIAKASGNLSALIKSGTLANYVLEYLGDLADLAGAKLVNFVHSTDLSKQAVIDAGQALLDLNAHYDAVAKNLQKGLNFGGGNKPLDLGFAGGDAIKAQMEEYQAAAKLADEQYKQTQEHLGAEAKLHQITYSQETAELLDALEDRHGAELAALAGEEMVGGLSVAQYQKIQDEKLQSDQKYAADRQKIVDQATEREAQEWKSAADQIAGAFNSQLRSLLAGTETWGQAMKKISGDIVLKFIEDQIKVTIEFLANQARQLAAAIATQTGMTTATTTGAALRSAAEAASGQTSILSVIANAIKAIGVASGQTSAEVTAQEAPAIGLAAIPVGAAAGATTMSTALAFLAAPSLDVGTDYVTRSGFAMIHEGEQIKPATTSGPYAGGSGGGGGDNHFHFHGPVIGTQQWLQQAKGQLASAVASKQSLSPSMSW